MALFLMCRLRLECFVRWTDQVLLLFWSFFSIWEDKQYIIKYNSRYDEHCHVFKTGFWIWKMVFWLQNIRVKPRGTEYKHCLLLLVKLFLLGVQINLKLLHMYPRTEQTSKWMADGGNQVSHCWSRRLQISKNIE